MRFVRNGLIVNEHISIRLEVYFVNRVGAFVEQLVFAMTESSHAMTQSLKCSILADDVDDIIFV